MTELTGKSTAKFTWTCGGNIHRFLLQSAVCKILELIRKVPLSTLIVWESITGLAFATSKIPEEAPWSGRKFPKRCPGLVCSKDGSGAKAAPPLGRTSLLFFCCALPLFWAPPHQTLLCFGFILGAFVCLSSNKCPCFSGNFPNSSFPCLFGFPCFSRILGFGKNKKLPKWQRKEDEG